MMNLPSFWKPGGFSTGLMRLLCAACAFFFSVNKTATIEKEEMPYARDDRHYLKLNPLHSEGFKREMVQDPRDYILTF